eukprot:gene337-171_t
MIDEILLALLGYSGDVVRETKAGLVLSPDAAGDVTISERDLVNRIVAAGHHYKSLERFISYVGVRHLAVAGEGARARCAAPGGLGAVPVSSVAERGGFAGSGQQHVRSGRESAASAPLVVGIFAQGLALSIDAYLEDEYRPLVAALEETWLAHPDTPLAHFHASLRSVTLVLGRLHELIDHVIAEKLAGGPLLDHVWRVTEATRDEARPALGRILAHLGSLWVQQVLSWCVYGLLWDPFGEFLVEDRAAGDVTAVLDLESLSTTSQAARFQWTAQFALRTTMVPLVFCPGPVADRILFVGKATRILVQSKRVTGSCSARVGDPHVSLNKELSARQKAQCAESLHEVVGMLQYVALGRPVPPVAWVVERAVEAIRVVVAGNLRDLVVGPVGGLREHLAGLKGFFGCSFGAFFQSFISEGRDVFLKNPGIFSQSELANGAWRAAQLYECDAAAQHAGTTREAVTAVVNATAGVADNCSSSAAKTVVANPRTAGYQIRVLPKGFLYKPGGFLEASQALWFFGEARLRQAEGALELQERARGSPGEAALPSMVWHSNKQQIAEGFQNHFSVQVASGARPVRFALLFQDSQNPAELKSRTGVDAGGAPASPDETSDWQALVVDALGVELTVRDTELSGRVAVTNGGDYTVLGDGSCPVGAAQEGVLEFAVSTLYDGRSLVVSVEEEGAGPRQLLEVSSFDVYSHLALDLGCGYTGFVALAPADTTEPDELELAPVVRSSVRILSWRHGKLQEELASAMLADPWHSCLAVSVDLPWPASLVVADDDISRYNRVFRLIFSYKRVQYGLAQIWLHKQVHPAALPPRNIRGGGAMSSSSVSSSALFRATLSFFVDQVLQYLQQDVFEAGHVQLLRVVDAAESDFEDLQRAHEAFLRRLLSDCFAEGSPNILRCLTGIVGICNRFIKIHSNPGPAAAAQEAHKLIEMESRMEEKLRVEFRDVAGDLLHLLSQLQDSSSHLQSLMLRLNYNGFFDTG